MNVVYYNHVLVCQGPNRKKLSHTKTKDLFTEGLFIGQGWGGEE